ncbi:MAG: TerB family tellurite resistance protein [Pseudomonadota bacterium]
MLDRLRDLFGVAVGPPPNAATGGAADPELTDADYLPHAAAMLLLEVAWADHELAAEELDSVAQSLRDVFQLNPDDAARLLDKARENHERSVGVYEYTRALNEAWEETAKVRLVEALWRLAFADQQITTFEEHTIRRISELLYVPHSAFIAAKRRARDRAPL